MRKILLLVIFVSFTGSIIYYLTGCDNVINSSRKVIFPDSLVSYQQHVEPFMQIKCSYEGCHCDFPPQPATRMTDYFSLFSAENAGLIIKGNPDASKLFLFTAGKLPHNPLFPYNYINENNKNGIRKWIEEGAENN